MIRNVLSVVAGFASWTALCLSANFAVAAAWPQHFAADGSPRQPWLLVLFVALSVLQSLLAGFVCARVARKRARGCAIALSSILLAVGIVVQLQYWNVMPLWYHLTFLALLAPSTMLGARLAQRTVARRTDHAVRAVG